LTHTVFADALIIKFLHSAETKQSNFESTSQEVCFNICG